MAILNKYVVCPVPAPSDPAWGAVVSAQGLKYSLDGSLVILKWPEGTMPGAAECTRLGGTCYDYSEIISLIAGKDWTAAT